jgi:hypothetical protein
MKVGDLVKVPDTPLGPSCIGLVIEHSGDLVVIMHRYRRRSVWRTRRLERHVISDTK